MSEDANSEAAAAPAKKKPIMLIAIVAVVALAGGGGAAFFFMGGKKGEETAEHGEKGEHGEAKKDEHKSPALYVKMDPPFVVNFEAKGLMRFLQVTVEVMTRDAATKDALEKNYPMIRNDLIMLFGSQTYDTISTREGKEKLRLDAIETVGKVIKAEGGDEKKVEQLYFTSFVMQ